MRALGWYDKPGVQFLKENGRILSTAMRSMRELRRFFEHLPDLLSGPKSRFSFFNGLGAINPLFYDVYTHIAELHLSDVGIDVKWSDVDVTSDENERWGESRKYFSLPLYRMPVGSMASIP
ncbi:hypothetical protein BD779DRAFT_1503459 [Infundibulicybe gibba]|nr:hypothetical protein BD779DRAFT_1503459 [Infundibulicybe gibba]